MSAPLLCEGRLTGADLDRYQLDLEALAQVLAVIPKQGSRAYVGPAELELAAGLAGLRHGSLRGLQVRYLHDGREWWDTLLPAPGGFRLVRIDHGPLGGGAT